MKLRFKFFSQMTSVYITLRLQHEKEIKFNLDSILTKENFFSKNRLLIEISLLNLIKIVFFYFISDL
jgi:hypothetical protein